MNPKQPHGINPDLDVDELARSLVDRISVNVVMARFESDSPWQVYRWELIGITINTMHPQHAEAATVVHQADLKQILYGGMPVQLHRDECESYYHNLMAPVPFCFVLTRRDENDVPVPFMVTLSFDEAHAYLEGDDEVYTAGLPAEIHQWLDAYVVANYVPRTRQKRKRDAWKETPK
jgi:hypothetical protein